ncbi:hypothetical protein DSO57_1013802 [Entomophthora muscae]|uniref:Uncharacterized protein n=1 Tax=Entomophthora muscae TaxID=34485 RepID=A0ACC2RWY1_9FUNG|nr:hypothetical protein DSO57_1013802 [Entomophthora muscae]
MRFKFTREFLLKEVLPNSLNWMLCVLMFVVSKVFDAFVPPFERKFSVHDVTISYPHTEKETVNNLWLWLCSLLFPAIAIVLLNFPKFKPREIHRALLGLFFSTALAYLVTHLTKLEDYGLIFLHRCEPSPSSILEAQPFYELRDGSVCNSKETRLIRGGRQSFFSGHTSTAFSGLGYLSLYISFVFTLWKKPGHVYKTWLALIPLLVALFIALSRIANYRHHWEDVLVGMIVGYSCAYFCFKQSLLLDYKEGVSEDLRPNHEVYGLERYTEEY